MNQTDIITNPQYKAVQCPGCLKKLFTPLVCGPIMQNRLDAKELQFVQGQSFKCVECGKIINLNAVGLSQEVLPE